MLVFYEWNFIVSRRMNKNGMLCRQYKTAQKVKRLVDCQIYDKEF